MEEEKTLEETLLPPSRRVGERLSIEKFGEKFDLDKTIVAKLKKIGYSRAAPLRLTKHSILKAEGFNIGEIDSIQDALDTWSSQST